MHPLSSCHHPTEAWTQERHKEKGLASPARRSPQGSHIRQDLADACALPPMALAVPWCGSCAPAMGRLPFRSTIFNFIITVTDTNTPQDLWQDVHKRGLTPHATVGGWLHCSLHRCASGAWSGLVALCRSTRYRNRRAGWEPKPKTRAFPTVSCSLMRSPYVVLRRCGRHLEGIKLRRWVAEQSWLDELPAALW